MESSLCPTNLYNPIDVSSLSIDGIFHPPTNQASKTNYYPQYEVVEPEVLLPSQACRLNSMSPPYVHTPWLPASKGDIKKQAQTRFVNSSPKSYCLMPASVESSEADRTSFVEKAFHKFLLPVSYFLEVAKLWAISNRSELECTFTLAKTEDIKTTSSFLTVLEEDKRRPICHSTEVPLKQATEDSTFSDKSNAESELLKSVNRILHCCQKRDKSLSSNLGISDITREVGSETRRYLSQIVSLMDKKFAKKLQNGLNKPSECTGTDSRKRSIVSMEESPRKRIKESPRVNVFTMLSEDQDESDNEQFVIIHIPTSQRKSNTTNESVHKANASDKKSSTSKEKKHKCYYCDVCFDEKINRARHMLSHLTSDIQT